MLKSVLAASLGILVSAAYYAEDVSAEDKVVCDGLSITTVGAAHETLQSSCLTKGEIELLPYRQFKTSTFWTDGIHRFEGAALADILKHVNDGFTSIKLVSENDYEVVVKASDIGPKYPIVATRMDGRPLDVNEMGPFWVVYPYDEAEEFRTSCAHARSVWMLASIEAYQ